MIDARKCIKVNELTGGVIDADVKKFTGSKIIRDLVKAMMNNDTEWLLQNLDSRCAWVLESGLKGEIPEPVYDMCKWHYIVCM
jgi:hypothetical protein